MNALLDMLNNFPLIAALIAILLAQFVKIPLFFITKRTWNLKRAVSTGGMPSSHSAAVSSLTAAVGITEGLSSSAFAIAVVLSAITMFDAAGIRRHAGIHASLINRIVLAEIASQQEGYEGYTHKTLNELLGHRPIEVFVGAVFGIVVSILLYWLFY